MRRLSAVLSQNKGENEDGEEELVVKGFRTAYVFVFDIHPRRRLAGALISRLSCDAPAVLDALQPPLGNLIAEREGDFACLRLVIVQRHTCADGGVP